MKFWTLDLLECAARDKLLLCSDVVLFSDTVRRRFGPELTRSKGIEPAAHIPWAPCVTPSLQLPLGHCFELRPGPPRVFSAHRRLSHKA